MPSRLGAGKALSAAITSRVRAGVLWSGRLNLNGNIREQCAEQTFNVLKREGGPCVHIRANVFPHTRAVTKGYPTTEEGIPS